MIPLLLAGGCMSLDPFFYAPETTSQYGFPSEVVPAELMEEVVFESADGNTLYGMWAHSEHPNRDPTIIYFHGNTGNIDTQMAQVDALYGIGLNIFTLDYRGYGRSPGTPDHDGVISDGVAAADFVVESGAVSSLEELGFVGLSLGGFVALHSALERPPGALITHDMFASADDLLELNTGMDIPAGWTFKDPYDNLTAASQLQVPYLITHGAQDVYISPESSKKVWEAANEPKELWLVPGGTHGETHQEAEEEYQARVGGWLERYL